MSKIYLYLFFLFNLSSSFIFCAGEKKNYFTCQVDLLKYDQENPFIGKKIGTMKIYSWQKTWFGWLSECHCNDYRINKLQFLYTIKNTVPYFVKNKNIFPDNSVCVGNGKAQDKLAILKEDSHAEQEGRFIDANWESRP